MIPRHQINAVQERNAVRPARPRWSNPSKKEAAPMLISEIIDTGTSVECVTTEIRFLCEGKVVVETVLHRTKMR